MTNHKNKFSRVYLLFIVLIALIFTTGPCLSAGDSFPAEAWNNRFLRSLLNGLSQQGSIKVPAEFAAASQLFGKNCAPAPVPINLLPTRNLAESSLLKPLQPYIHARYSPAICQAVSNRDLQVNLIKGNYLAGLLAIFASRQQPLVEFTPEKSSGSRIVIAWNPQANKAALWILGISSDSLLAHHHAMISVLDPDCKIRCAAMPAAGFSLKQAMAAFPYQAPDLWVIGFRDTMKYMLEERESMRQQLGRLRVQFSENIRDGIISQLDTEARRKPSLARYFAWADLSSRAATLPSFLVDETFAGTSDWFWATREFLKKLSQLARLDQSPKTLQSLHEILAPAPWEMPVSVGRFCFLPHPDLFLIRIEFTRKDGSAGSLVLVENPYGEQALELIRAIGNIDHDAQILYLGTCASIDKVRRAGDIVALTPGLPEHLYSVQSPVLETRAMLENLQNQKYELVDVEGKWFKQGLQEFPQINFKSMMLVSDTPLAGTNLNTWENDRRKMNRQLELMVDAIYGISSMYRPVTLDQDGEITRQQFFQMRRQQLIGPDAGMLPAELVENCLEFEKQRSLLPTWCSPFTNGNPGPTSISSRWKKAIADAASSDYQVAGAAALGDLMPPVTGEMLYFWRIDEEYLKVSFHLKEPADSSFMTHLVKTLGRDFDCQKLERATPGGKTIYALGQELTWLKNGLRVRYVPFFSPEGRNDAFLQDRGLFSCSFHEQDMEKAVRFLAAVSQACGFYPESDGLINGQIALPGYQNLMNCSPLPVSHKITRNRFEKNYAAKLTLDIDDILRLLRYPRLMSAQRRIDEGKVLETTKVRMEDIDDSDIGSGQNHLVYLSLGSGIDYYDTPWQVQSDGLPAPRIILDNAYVYGRYNEFYPRNSWDTIAGAYSRYAEIVYFQGGRPNENYMSSARRCRYLSDLTRCLCRMGLAASEFPFDKFRFWDISGQGNYINNEIRVSGQADLTGLIIGIAVPKGAGEAYRQALVGNGFDPSLIYEAPVSGNSGIRLAYLQCLLDRRWPTAASLLRAATERPLLLQKIEKVAGQLVLDELENQAGKKP